MSKDAMKLATELNRHFTSLNGVDVPARISVPRDEWRALFAALAEQPAQQQEPDLSGLKPSTQEVIKGWIEDGTFIERAIGAMQEQEAENMRLEKMAAPQPAQQEQVAIVDDSGVIVVCSYKYKPGDKLYTSPPAQRKPLPYNKEDMKDLDINQRLAFKLGWKSAEEAHGIKENT